MWKSDELGLASWQTEHSTWSLDARGGSHGIAMVDGDRSRNRSADRLVAFAPVGQDVLPAVAEQYVRGDTLHLTYLQGEGAYELRLALRPIVSSDQRLVLEGTVAIQTDHLDSHPTVDVEVNCDSFVGDPIDGIGAPPISQGTSKDHSVAILLGPHDSPFTTDESSESALRLRLFGDFLEKGVIRKARPWIVVSRGKGPKEEELQGWWKQLCESPLPLTA